MSIPLDIGKKVVDKLRPKFDDVAVVINQKDYVMVKLWNSEPSVTQSWMDTQVSLLLTKDKKVLMLGLSVRDPEAILGAVENLGPAIQNMEESELYAPLPEPTRLSPLTETVDKAVIEAMRDPSPLVEEMLEGGAEYKVDRVAGTLVLGKSTRTLVTSKGFEGVEEGTELEAYLRAFKGEFSGHWAFGSRRLEKEMIRDVGAKAGYYIELCGGFKPTADRGRIRMILPNGFVKKATRRLWFDPSIPPGSTIEVPERQAGRFGLREVVKDGLFVLMGAAITAGIYTLSD